MKVPYLSPDIAAAKVIAGGLDAFFAVAGFPSQNDSRVVLSGHAEVLPIDCPAVDIALLESSRGKIPLAHMKQKSQL